MNNIAGVRRWGPIAAYFGAWTLLAHWYWNLLNPDTVSYFSIAHHYLRGEWREAVNTGWSPMSSWLMVPLAGLGMPDVAAMRIFTALSGGLTLYAVDKLAEDFELRPGWRLAAMYTAAGMVLAYSLLRLGPDLLEAALLLLYTRVVIRRDYATGGRGAVAGAWGAAAFLTKGYALYFFLGHFALMHLLHAWREPSEAARVRRQWAVGMTLFLILSAPWVIAMSYKAGHLSAGTTGAWNFRLVGPESPGYPQYFGLIPPPGPHGSSMWEEPEPALLPKWNPLASPREVKHQIRLILANVRESIRLVLYTSLLIPVAILAYVIWGFRKGASTLVPWILPVATILVYPAGYLLIVIVDRYFWNVFLLILLLGAMAFQAVAARIPRLPGALLMSAYFLSFLALPTRMMMVQAKDTQQRWAEIAAQIQRQAPGLSGRLAGCGGWNDGVQIAWSLGMPFYGETGPTAEELTVRDQLNPSAQGTPQPIPGQEEIAHQLKRYRVDYFLALPACV